MLLLFAAYHNAYCCTLTVFLWLEHLSTKVKVAGSKTFVNTITTDPEDTWLKVKRWTAHGCWLPTSFARLQVEASRQAEEKWEERFGHSNITKRHVYPSASLLLADTKVTWTFVLPLFHNWSNRSSRWGWRPVTTYWASIFLKTNAKEYIVLREVNNRCYFWSANVQVPTWDRLSGEVARWKLNQAIL